MGARKVLVAAVVAGLALLVWRSFSSHRAGLGDGMQGEDLLVASIPDDPGDFHIFLLAGQSNMVGRARGKPGSGEARSPSARVLALDRDGNWVVAEDPIHFDDGAGVGLGTTFADLIVKSDPEITVGLVPCAVGGSPISAWEPGSRFEPTGQPVYDRAVSRFRRALELGTAKAVLWHQGESDGINLRYAVAYRKRLKRLAERLRQEAGDPALPFLVGELGRYLTPVPEAPGALPLVRNAQAQFAMSDPRAILVSSAGMGHKGDRLHFDAKSLREFGRRFASAYLSMR